ncbi:MAG TPA: ABC transporter ATP-binding protein [Mycobacteriales bacterium]|nr:ABC transporter ATP-binding protein [Mycobacteriales bacterium]
MIPDQVRGFGLWISIGFKAAPILTSFSFILGILQGLAGPLQALGISLAVNGLIEHERGSLIAGVAVVGATVAANLLIITVNEPMSSTVLFKANSYVHGDLMRIIGGIPGIEHHENPEVADRIDLLHRSVYRLSFAIVEILFFAMTAVNAATIVALLVSVSPWLVLLLAVGVVRIVTGFVDSRLKWNAIKATMQENRLANRLQEQTKSSVNSTEIRVFGLRKVLLQRLDEAYGNIESRRSVAVGRGARYEVLSRVLFGAAYAGAIAYVAVQVRHGDIKPGGIALVVLLGSRIEQAAGGVANLTRNIGETVRTFSLYAWLRRYARQRTWEEATRPAPERLTHGIELRDVSFRYPSADRPVLKDVNLFLPAGSSVALVGENGAGKSTLVKLLGRLYDPTTGSVLVDGVDLREISPDDWRRRTAAAFQDFVKFEFPAGRVVGVGDLPHLDDEPAIRIAIDRGGAETVVSQLANGLDTQLGKRFTDGVDLSGGQWQRLALSRGFMRSRPLLLLLDEPTAALDPEAEHRLYDQFAALARSAAQETGGVTVLVSHRFSTVRMADLIVVMEGGEIVEIGTHEELVENGRGYAEMFELQARAYRS